MNYPTQRVGVRVNLFQLRPGGIGYDLIALSDLFIATATPEIPSRYQDYTFTDQPIGPTYVVVTEMFWYQADGISIDGMLQGTIDHYQWVQIKDDNPTPLKPARDCASPILPKVAAPEVRGIVNSAFPFHLVYFPINRAVNVRFDGRDVGPVQTDDRGEVVGSFRIPAMPMGNYDVRWFTGDWNARASFTIIPRIKLTPDEAAPDELIGISLRGYAAHETVRIRWKRGSSWLEIARVTTSSTGSANTTIRVPDWAPAGPAPVRGDSTASSGGRAQTNAFTVVRPAPGTLALSSVRGTVNSQVTATIANFPPNRPVTLTFSGFYSTTASGTTDATGSATLSFRVPASPLGVYHVNVAGGSTGATGNYEVVPRIKLTPGEAARGDTIGVSLRGFGARETVRIRWKHGSSYEEVATVTTSGSGSANLTITVPSWALDGPQSVRGDGSIGRAQTNAFSVSGGNLSGAGADTPSPTATATPTTAATPAVIPPTTEPDPTSTPIFEPTPSPTASPPEATPML
jgi:hypothetical protein